MKHVLALLALAPALAACPSNQQIAEAQARHREYVCSHSVSVTAAANLAIQNADKIKDQRIRDAAIAAANAELAIVAACQ